MSPRSLTCFLPLCFFLFFPNMQWLLISFRFSAVVPPSASDGTNAIFGIFGDGMSSSISVLVETEKRRRRWARGAMEDQVLLDCFPKGGKGLVHYKKRVDSPYGVGSRQQSDVQGLEPSYSRRLFPLFGSTPIDHRFSGRPAVRRPQLPLTNAPHRQTARVARIPHARRRANKRLNLPRKSGISPSNVFCFEPSLGSNQPENEIAFRVGNNALPHRLTTWLRSVPGFRVAARVVVSSF